MKETIVNIEKQLKQKKKQLRAKENKNKRIYAKLKENGMCIWCKKRKAVPPHVRCEECMDRTKCHQ